VLISLEVHYLIDVKAAAKGVRLNLFTPSTSVWEEVLDKEYRPYFFIPHPISRRDRETVEGLGAKTMVDEKRDLFTGHKVRVTKVEIEEASDLRSASKKFEKAWEGEVPYILGYAYDQGLNFGAQHLIQGEQVKNVFQISEKAMQRFDKRFSGVRQADPVKYNLLKRWFTLCSQPVPEITPESLGIGGKVDPERYYLAFMLSRVANLPVPMAYSSRQVSTWIKSILHNHLRRNNILIPTSKELRRRETKRSVQGALTFPPEPGAHFNTVVTDFESLYPSLIDAYNLSYETIDCHHKECQENRVPGLEHHVCTQRRGVYSLLIGALKDLRIHWFKPLAKDKTISSEERRLAQATSQLLKLILVSSYGVTVRIHGLARPSLAESITAYGRHSLQTTWDIAKEGGLHPIYGDTDSLFLDDPGEEQVEWLIKTVKERLQLDLAVDERYSVCVLPKAMKAYFGIRRDGTPDVKGVTAIKSNSPIFIQNVFRNCVEEMADVKNQADFEMAKERIQRIVGKAIEDLKAGRVSLKDLEYPVELHEDPHEKMREPVLHQPYQCAFQLIDSGKSVQRGDIVNFVKVKSFTYRGRTFTVKPTERLRNFQEVNVEDYVRNLRTALNQTFKPLDLRFREEAEKRSTLSDFI
jgi:DNA polymerase elongation subunit (family B)